MYAECPPPPGDRKGPPIHPSPPSPLQMLASIVICGNGHPQEMPLHFKDIMKFDRLIVSKGKFHFELLVFFDWPGKFLLCSLFQLPFITPYEDGKCYDEKHS